MGRLLVATGRLLTALVIRRPTPAELAHRTSVVLTRRDVQLLVALHRFGFLTSELIELAFFPPIGPDRRSPCTRAYGRLRALWLSGYVERVELPQQGSGGRLPYLYALGRLGVPRLQPFFRAPVQVRRIDRPDALFVDHDVKAAGCCRTGTRPVGASGSSGRCGWRCGTGRAPGGCRSCRMGCR
jgi:hypothetical protein